MLHKIIWMVKGAVCGIYSAVAVPGAKNSHTSNPPMVCPGRFFGNFIDS